MRASSKEGMPARDSRRKSVPNSRAAQPSSLFVRSSTPLAVFAAATGVSPAPPSIRVTESSSLSVIRARYMPSPAASCPRESEEKNTAVLSPANTAARAMSSPSPPMCETVSPR